MKSIKRPPQPTQDTWSYSQTLWPGILWLQEIQNASTSSDLFSFPVSLGGLVCDHILSRKKLTHHLCLGNAGICSGTQRWHTFRNISWERAICGLVKQTPCEMVCKTHYSMRKMLPCFTRLQSSTTWFIAKVAKPSFEPITQKKPPSLTMHSLHRQTSSWWTVTELPFCM